MPSLSRQVSLLQGEGATAGTHLYVADKRHPSLAGTYLAAATTYGALFRKSPVGLTYTSGPQFGDRRILAKHGVADLAGVFPVA